MGVVDADRVSRRLGIDSVDRENVVRRWSAARAISKRSKERERVPLPRTRLERILEPERVSTVDRGHKISDHLRSTLNSFDKKGWRRSIHQRKMHKMMHAALAVQIYEDAVYTHQKEILDYNGWDSLKQEIMVTAPRRFGKSWGVGMFVSSAAVCVPHADIGVFSTGSRVSGNNDGMSAIVKMMLTQVLGIEKFTRDSGEYLFFEVSHGDVRKIKTFPGSVHSYVFRFRVFAGKRFFFFSPFPSKNLLSAFPRILFAYK